MGNRLENKLGIFSIFFWFKILKKENLSAKENSDFSKEKNSQNDNINKISDLDNTNSKSKEIHIKRALTMENNIQKSQKDIKFKNKFL